MCLGVCACASLLIPLPDSPNGDPGSSRATTRQPLNYTTTQHQHAPPKKKTFHVGNIFVLISLLVSKIPSASCEATTQPPRPVVLVSSVLFPIFPRGVRNNLLEAIPFRHSFADSFVLVYFFFITVHLSSRSSGSSRVSSALCHDCIVSLSGKEIVEAAAAA